MSLTKKILKILGEDLNLIKGASELKYLPYKLVWGDLSEKYDKAAIKMALARSIKKGFIKKQIMREQVYLALTDLGRQALAKEESKPVFILKRREMEWDGRYRLVIFDIPEKDRIIRDALRKQLRQLGCVGWQKSVWVTKQDITEAINTLVEENSLGDHVLVLEVEDLDNKKLGRLIDLSEESIKLG